MATSKPQPTEEEKKKQQQQAQQLAERDRRVALFDQLKKAEPQLRAAAGKILDVTRQIQLARTMISRNPTLGDCSVLSIVNGVLQATQLGLELDGVLGQAYLVPFRNHGRWEAQCIPGARGYVVLMHRSGRVQGVHPDVVKANDRFKWQKGTQHFLHHVYAEGDRGDLTHAYAVVHYRGGGYDFVVLTRADVERIRASSPAFRYAEQNKRFDSPWHTHPEPMWAKTAVRQLAKQVPLSPQAQRAALLEEYNEAGISVDVLGLEADVPAIDVGADGGTPAAGTEQVGDDATKQTKQTKAETLAAELAGGKPAETAREPGAEG